MKEYNDSGEEPLIASLVIDAGFASLEAGGTTSFDTFVKGCTDGCVCIWDHRNSKVWYKLKTPRCCVLKAKQA